MAKTFLIAYDLKKPGQSYSEHCEAIKLDKYPDDFLDEWTKQFGDDEDIESKDAYGLSEKRFGSRR